jgi:hypothetical protein
MLLEEGWDEAFSDAVWPEALLAAVRRDAGALSSQRAVATLRAWQADARGRDPERQKIALEWLSLVGEALSSPDPSEVTVAKVPEATRTGRLVDSTESEVRALSPRNSSEDPGWMEREEGVTDALVQGQLLAFQNPPPEDSFESAAFTGPVPSRPPPLPASFDEDRSTPTPRSEVRPPPLRSGQKRKTAPPPLPRPDSESSPARVPPKPGSVRRSPMSQSPQPRRPRASQVQVRTLYTAISSLCRELLPLAPERRSRRFWSYWRDVSGDRGVRREFVEALLRRTDDFRELTSELIAEALGVDLGSVRSVVEKLEAHSGEIEDATIRLKSVQEED